MKNRRVRYLSDLSPASRRLVDNIRWIGHGHIDRLRIHDADPVWNPPPDIYSDRKYGGNEIALPLHEQENCELNKHFSDLFAEFDERRNFTITRLIVQNGLPIRREVREKPV